MRRPFLGNCAVLGFAAFHRTRLACSPPPACKYFAFSMGLLRTQLVRSFLFVTCTCMKILQSGTLSKLHETTKGMSFLLQLDPWLISLWMIARRHCSFYGTGRQIVLAMCSVHHLPLPRSASRANHPLRYLFRESPHPRRQSLFRQSLTASHTPRI